MPPSSLEKIKCNSWKRKKSHLWEPFKSVGSGYSFCGTSRRLMQDRRMVVFLVSDPLTGEGRNPDRDRMNLT